MPYLHVPLEDSFGWGWVRGSRPLADLCPEHTLVVACPPSGAFLLRSSNAPHLGCTHILYSIPVPQHCVIKNRQRSNSRQFHHTGLARTLGVTILGTLCYQGLFFPTASLVCSCSKLDSGLKNYLGILRPWLPWPQADTFLGPLSPML